jgi:hypothetical protein
MANFSIELGRLADGGFKVFDFPYDFYDETKRKDFEQLFIDKFYNYEICCETPGRWQRYLSVLMRTKFPYYNMLLVTTQINYEKTKNYNITETQNRTVNNTSNTTGSNKVDNSLHSNDSISNNSSFSNQSTDIGNKTNNLDSVTDHTNRDTTDRTETQKDSSKVILDSDKSLDATKVHSITPKSMLSLTDLKSNIFASDADRNDNKEKEDSTTTSTADKTNTIKETDEGTTKDIVNADNVEASRNENEASGTTTNTGSTSKVETGNTTGSMTQNETGNTTENYTRTMSGSYGVITEADMLQKHIALQEKLTNIYDQFFENECYDLFYQLWN